MRIRALAMALVGLALAGLWLPPDPVQGRQPASDTPPPTIASCLTLPPDQQSGCFETKVAVEEIQRQTQDVLGTTATAQAVEQQIKGTLAAEAATVTPAPTLPDLTATSPGFSVAVPGLDNVKLDTLGLIGLAVCALGGIALIGLGVYLVRGAGAEQADEAVAAGRDSRRDGEPQMEVRPVVVSTAATILGAPVSTTAPAPGAPQSAQTPEVGADQAPALLETTLTERLTPAPAGLMAMLVSGGGHQLRITSGDFSIGRAFENDLVVDARFPGYENVSAEHARIVQDSGLRWIVEDLGSANGTFVNDQPTTMNLLRDGWRVAFGPVEFTFRLIPPEAHS